LEISAPERMTAFRGVPPLPQEHERGKDGALC
jgi:hypothetical protein